ncbi:hypothetical protein ACSBR2_024533 [Camellia fascicularis]
MEIELNSIELVDGPDTWDKVSQRCLLGKILGSKSLNKQAVSSIIHGAWKVRNSFSISPWNDNLFLFTFEDDEDRQWVLEEAPWSVMGNLMVLKLVELGSPASEMDFTWEPFLGPGQSLGRLIRVDGHCEGLLLNRSFLRIRVELDVTKPLPRGFFLKQFGTSTRATKELWIDFKIEKVSNFCFDCGHIGHDRNSCKFVTREEGRTSGYGPELKTGITRSSGLPEAHSKKQVEEIKTRSRATLYRPVNNSGPSISPARGNCARVGEMSKTINASVHGQGTEAAERNPVVPGGDIESLDRNSVEPEGDVVHKAVDQDRTTTPDISLVKRDFHSIKARHTLRVKEALGALIGPSNRPGDPQTVLGPRYFVTEPVDPILLISPQPTTSNPLVSPIQIEEVSPNSSPICNDLRTKVVDECMSTVFNWLTLKRKACEDDNEGRSPKLLKCAALTDVPLQPSKNSTTLS